MNKRKTPLEETISPREFNKLKQENTDLKKEIAALHTNVKKLNKDSKYLRDRIRIVENQGTAFYRTINELKQAVNRLSGIFK